MNKTLPRYDWPTLVTVFLALGGIGMMVIFSILIGFGIHSPIGKIALYICFALQLINVGTMALRRRLLQQKYGAPAPTKKMRRFLGFNFGIWVLGAFLLIFALVCDIFWFKSIDAPVMYPCVIGAILAPIGWLGLLASFHRRREAALHAQK